MCCSSWDCKESDKTEGLKNNKFEYLSSASSFFLSLFSGGLLGES